MRKIALLTPTYQKDLDRFELLCESLDSVVTGFERHYVLVNPDSDVEYFQRFASAKRVIIPASALLPKWLWSAPAWFKRNGRRVWLSPFAPPIHGWHVQQLLKIAGVLAAPEDRTLILDSDNLFFRPFDVRDYAARDLTPLYVDRDHIQSDNPKHGVWARNAAKLLGLPEPAFPAHDYIGQAIVWDKATVRAMTERIEAVTGHSWQLALCRTRRFSEYLTYGAFVANAPEYAARHEEVTMSLSHPHWEDEELDAAKIAAMFATAQLRQVALCIQSYAGADIGEIRSALQAAKAA